jgi:hypothetical protein
MGWQSGKDALGIISDTERREPVKQEACTSISENTYLQYFMGLRIFMEKKLSAS